MPPSALTTIHVNGPVLPQCNLGAAGAYVTVGECQDGVSIQILPKEHGVYADGGGGLSGEPIEYLMLNAIAVIRFKLVPYSGLYVNALRAKALASSIDGSLPIPGTPYGANSMFPGLYIPYGGAQDPDGPWFFPANKVIAPGNPTVWTKETTPEFELRAMVYYDPSVRTSVAGPGIYLYSRSAPP